MKSRRLVLLAAILTGIAQGQSRMPLPAEPVIPSTTNVTVPTTASELATGYAQAIQQMSLKSIVIFLRSDGKTVSIKGIRAARAMGAVLLVEFSAGDRLAVNAEQIVMITDGARTP